MPYKRIWQESHQEEANEAERGRQRLTQIETWLLETVQADPTLLADLESRRQAVARCHAPQGEMPPGVRVPPDKVFVRSMGDHEGTHHHPSMSTACRIDSRRRDRTRQEG